jgi:hypothetical protein
LGVISETQNLYILILPFPMGEFQKFEYIFNYVRHDCKVRFFVDSAKGGYPVMSSSLSTFFQSRQSDFRLAARCLFLYRIPTYVLVPVQQMCVHNRLPYKQCTPTARTS